MKEHKYLVFLVWSSCLLHCIFATLALADWVEVGSFNAMEGENHSDQAGYSIAISFDGQRVAVGEPYWFEGGANGRVRVYDYISGNWTIIGGATSITGENAADLAGSSVAISSNGNIVAVGEPGWDSNNGRVRVYQLLNGVWTETGGATSMTGETSQAGWSVAINSNGTIVAVGEPSWGGFGTPFFSGRVRTYNMSGGVWTEFGGATAMAGQNLEDGAGFSVAINANGTIVAVGENGWNTGSGRVRTYSLSGGVWTEFGGTMSMTGQNLEDNAGCSVAISENGTVVAVGENNWNSGSGRVRTYSLSDGTWTEFGGATTITGQNLGDNAGQSVAISSDGQTIAVGEPGWYSGNGRVRVYGLQEGVWVSLGSSTAMTGTELVSAIPLFGIGAGASVAISADGKIVAFGETGAGFDDYGRARVYRYVIINVFNVNSNEKLSKIIYSDISKCTTPGNKSNLSAPGQGVPFAYNPNLGQYIITKGQ